MLVADHHRRGGLDDVRIIPSMPLVESSPTTGEQGSRPPHKSCADSAREHLVLKRWSGLHYRRRLHPHTEVGMFTSDP